MKALQLIFSIFFCCLFFSCNDDEQVISQAPPSDNVEFFNLNVGNRWVYNRYHKNTAQPDIVYTSIDSVSVDALVTIDGTEYAKIVHSSGLISFEYMRVDEYGHLVGFYGGEYFPDVNNITDGYQEYVYHPGMDMDYERTDNESYGSIHYFVEPLVEINVEGNAYQVIPYYGDFSPTDPSLPNKLIEINYQPQIGMIKSISHAVAGPTLFEDMLVSYHLEN